MPVGHFFDVITNGFGTMYPFRARIKPYDRWAIAAYIRVLQASQHQPADSIPADELQKLMTLPEDPSQNAAPELPVGQPSPLIKNEPGSGIEPTPGQANRGVRTVPIGRRPANQLPKEKGVPAQSDPAGAATSKPGGMNQ